MGYKSQSPYGEASFATERTAEGLARNVGQSQSPYGEASFATYPLA